MSYHLAFIFKQSLSGFAGGASTFESELLSALLHYSEKSANKCSVITPWFNKKYLSKLITKNIEIKYYLFSLNSFNLFRRIGGLGNYYLSLLSAIKSHDYDHIFCCGPYAITDSVRYSSIIWDIAHLTHIRDYFEVRMHNGISNRHKRLKMIGVPPRIYLLVPLV